MNLKVCSSDCMAGSGVQRNYHPAEQIANIMDRIYRFGLTTASGGNLSILDENGDIWITPSGVDKGNLTAHDIIKVKPDGSFCGTHKPSLELPFHKAIYEKRPDVKAVLHAHSPSVVAFSITGRMPDTSLVMDSYSRRITQTFVEYALPGSSELAVKVADAFEKGSDAVMLENHGVVVAAKDLFSAYEIYETLDYCSRLELNALKLGNIKVPELLKYEFLVENRKCVIKYASLINSMTDEDVYIIESLCQIAKRAYNKKLLYSSSGAVSHRFSGNSFIITPGNCDFLNLESEQLNKISCETQETGKALDHYCEIHKIIYKMNPNINSIITAAPPDIMAFGVSENSFDSRIIPESYLILRDVDRFTIDIAAYFPDRIANYFSEKKPVAIIENFCVVTTGETVFKAYDRLEVLDYSARAILDSIGIGTLKTIESKSIRDIEISFKLPC